MGELIADLKQSLLTPDADFVKMARPGSEGTTIRMTDKQLHEMKEQLRQNKAASDREDAFEGDGDEADEDESLNPTLEKVLTSLGIVAAILVVGIAIFAGYRLWSSVSGKEKTPEATESPKATEQIPKDHVRMISLQGKTYEEAKKALQEIQLGIEEGEKVNSDQYAKGLIVQQSVEEGTIIKTHEKIIVSVSKGAGALTVPTDLVGKSQAEVLNLLEEIDLKGEVVSDYSNSVEMGNVISVEPESGTEVNKGDTIKVTVSRGKKKVSVPSLLGKSQEEAEAELNASGLRLGNVTTSEKLSETVAAGRVMSQNYSSGMTVEHGTAVDIVLSKGMEEAIWKGTLEIQKTDLPEDFQSGMVKVELIQVVNGEQKTTVVQERQMTGSDFPLKLQLTGAKSVASGRVLIYIDNKKVDGEHSVVFTEE